MSNFQINELRRNPITRRWVIYQKNLFTLEEILAKIPKSEDTSEQRKIENCPFCAGNESLTPPVIRTYKDGKFYPHKDINNWEIRVVPNKYPVFRIEGEIERRGKGMVDVMNGKGAHEIIIESPNHYEYFEDFPLKSIYGVFMTYRERAFDLEQKANLGHLFIFKTQIIPPSGNVDHPHSQLIISPIIPEKVKRELGGAKDYFNIKERCVFCDIIDEHLNRSEQVIEENSDFISLVPIFSSKLIEIWILPKNHSCRFSDIETESIENLARITKNSLGRMKKLFSPLSFSLHLFSAPNKAFSERRKGYWESLESDYHWHFKIIFRSPIITDYYGNFNLGTGIPLNPVLPEQVAYALRNV